MASCAIEECGDPRCAVCSVNKRFLVVSCSPTCRMVAGHPGECQKAMRAGKAERAELKD